MASDFPPELVEEILSRVPAKSLSRLRCTCKRWNTLFKDQRFTKNHCDRAAKQSMVLMLKLNESKVYSLSVNLHGINNNTAAPSMEFKGELSLKDSHSEKVDICGVFHCDGLLLCTTKNSRLVVWNPCTGEARWIILRSGSYKNYKFALGYVSNNSCRSYKLLIYRDKQHVFDRIEFEIYEFSSDSWRVVKITDNFVIRSFGVSLKGNTYWLVYHNALLCFNFSTEQLERLCLPFQDTSCAEALSTFRGEQLSVLHQRYDTLKMEIWVTTVDKTTDQNIVLSWRKFLSIDNYKLSCTHMFSYYLSFFIEEEEKVVICCDSIRGLELGGQTIKNMVSAIGEYGEVHFEDSPYKVRYGLIFNYTPSLVQIEQCK